MFWKSHGNLTILTTGKKKMHLLSKPAQVNWLNCAYISTGMISFIEQITCTIMRIKEPSSHWLICPTEREVHNRWRSCVNGQKAGSWPMPCVLVWTGVGRKRNQPVQWVEIDGYPFTPSAWINAALVRATPFAVRVTSWFVKVTWTWIFLIH